MSDIPASTLPATMGTPNDEEKEKRENFHRIVCAFKYYRTLSLQRVAKSDIYFLSLPEHHRALLDDYRHHLLHVRFCIEKNNYVIKLIIEDTANMFANFFSADPAELGENMIPQSFCCDLDKVQVTLKQLVRDWSDDGLSERQACYHPIIEEIVTHFPTDLCAAKDVKVLVPGAGLGRLPFEIARRGYSCEANEFSLFMIFASNFVLNKCRVKNEYTIYPWVHQYMNNLESEHQAKSVSFPDINPADFLADAHLSVTSGDFLELYTKHNYWDCVATCFFTDCVHNIVQFIETIYNILKPGGLWVNLGPLLYHFSGIELEDSIEPSFEVVKTIIKGIGFELLKEETDVKTTYAQNPNSMLQYYYKSVFYVCRKPHPPQQSDQSGDGHTVPATTAPREAVTSAFSSRVCMMTTKEGQ